MPDHGQKLAIDPNLGVGWLEFRTLINDRADEIVRINRLGFDFVRAHPGYRKDLLHEAIHPLRSGNRFLQVFSPWGIYFVAIILQNDLGKTLDGAYRRPQIVREAIAKRF